MMSALTRSDFDSICRVCMRGREQLFVIFDEKYSVEGENFASILSECTQFKVDRSDELPHLICKDCMDSARTALRFKRDCEQSYRTLLQLLASKSEQRTTSRTPPFRMKTDSDEKGTQTEDTTLYPCERCEKKFFTYDALRTHRENDHKGSAIVCRFCCKTFNRVGYLKTHIAVFHPETGYTSHNQCHICQRQFTRREHMRRHMAVIHKIVEVISDDLQTPDTSEEAFVMHPQSENGDETLSSDILASTLLPEFVDSDSLNEIHLAALVSPKEEKLPETKGENNEIKVECLDVDAMSSDGEEDKPLSFLNCASTKIFPEEVLLSEQLGKEDESRGIDEEQLPLNSCVRRTTRHIKKLSDITTLPELRPAMRDGVDIPVNPLDVEEHGKSLQCDSCDMEFLDTAEYKRHRETNHVDKLHKCGVCPKAFTAKMYLQRHQLTHNRRRYTCKECSKSHSSRDELTAHIKAEGHDKPMLCPECGLRCKTSNVLMVHMRRHNGEKPFKCKFCSKGFPRVDDLRVHEKYHTGEKSHFCETCGKGFQRKYNLTIHLRVHTGEKPYKCPHCPQAFAQGNDLKSHIRRHTGERFRCEYCDAAFLQGYQIRQHKLTEHGIRENPPTQRVAKFTSPEEQEVQIKQILTTESTNPAIEESADRQQETRGSLPHSEEVKQNN